MEAWLSRRQPECLWLSVSCILLSRRHVSASSLQCLDDAKMSFFLLVMWHVWGAPTCYFLFPSSITTLVWGQEVQPSITDRSRDAFACSSSVFNVHVHLEAMHGFAPSSQHQRFAGSTRLWLDEPEWRRLLGWISSFLCSTRPSTTSLHHHQTSTTSTTTITTTWADLLVPPQPHSNHVCEWVSLTWVLGFWLIFTWSCCS